jgi:uncharacterized membrane protein YhhN
MKKQIWVLAFVAALLADIAGIQINNELLQWISKPLILPFLFLYFFSSTNAVSSPLKKWIYFALFFSWAGDVLLMFQGENELFFLLGLSAFLLAHIFYILYFHFVRIREKIPGNGWYLLFLLIYYSVLMRKLSPYLGELTIPVRVYGLVISIMLLMAMHMTSLRLKNAGWSMLTGAALFVLSDSVLAINKFYQPFDLAGLVIMLTYGAAQYFIVKGAIEYLRTGGK